MAETIARRAVWPCFRRTSRLTSSRRRELGEEPRPGLRHPLTLAGCDHRARAQPAAKRAHGAVIVISGGRPVGVVTDADCRGVDRLTQLSQVMSADLFTLPAGTDPEQAFSLLHGGRHRLAPVVDEAGRCVGILTLQHSNAPRSPPLGEWMPGGSTATVGPARRQHVPASH